MKRTEAQKVTLEAFRNGPTHANMLSYEVKDADSLVHAITRINFKLFGAYLQIKNVKSDDFDTQRVYARVYAESIMDMLRDFIDSSERGELDG